MGGKFSGFAPIRPLDSPGSVTGSDCDVEGSSQAKPLSESPLRFSTRHHHLHYPSASLSLYAQGATSGPPLTGDRFQPKYIDRTRSIVEIRSRTSSSCRLESFKSSRKTLRHGPEADHRWHLHPSFHATFAVMRDEYVGVLLAVCSSVAIGTSYVTTKIGLRDACERHGFKGDGFEYFRNPIWWTGMVMLVVGEIFNFAAYAFAPAVLVTPLGALAVLTGTILGAYFLNERLSVLGKMGCALCLVGSVLIVANAPPDKDIQTVNEILALAVQPGRSSLLTISVGQVTK